MLKILLWSYIFCDIIFVIIILWAIYLFIYLSLDWDWLQDPL